MKPSCDSEKSRSKKPIAVLLMFETCCLLVVAWQPYSYLSFYQSNLPAIGRRWAIINDELRSTTQTPPGPKALSIIKGCPLLRGYASHTLSNYWAWSLGSSAKLQHMDHKSHRKYLVYGSKAATGKR